MRYGRSTVAKAYTVEDPPEPIGFSDLHILTIPSETFHALTDSANARGLTLAQLVQKAFDGVLQTIENQGPRGPRLLTEQQPVGGKPRG